MSFDFPEHLPWINSSVPLRLNHELKGQVILLHFWTYTCIHCQRTLDDMEHLRKKYAGQPFVIIGVHVGKYGTNESAIREAVTRHTIVYPIIIDQDRAIWAAYGATSWPTMMLVGADGQTVGALSGEGHRALLEHSIERTLRRGRLNGAPPATPLPPFSPTTTPRKTPLSYPAKILADTTRRRLIVLDSHHHRILLTTWPDADANVTVEQSIGSATPGLQDGNFAEAAFNTPQGATLSTGRNNAAILWIADTANHCIRRIDLEENRVLTILGTGQPEFDNEAGKTGREQSLNSPRDVALFANRLYISQSGQHQIFAMNLMTGMTEIAAGTARESFRDAEATRAYLAQPAGLTMDAHNQILYFADAENSAIRSLDLQKKQVITLVGEGLFEFGDIDGYYQKARLQHCMGLSLNADATQLLIADTGNNKIKSLDLATRTVKTIAGGGWTLFEPASVTHAPTPEAPNDALIADTNHHRIVRLNTATGACKELVFHNLPPA